MYTNWSLNCRLVSYTGRKLLYFLDWSRSSACTVFSSLYCLRNKMFAMFYPEMLCSSVLSLLCLFSNFMFLLRILRSVVFFSLVLSQKCFVPLYCFVPERFCTSLLYFLRNMSLSVGFISKEMFFNCAVMITIYLNE